MIEPSQSRLILRQIEIREGWYVDHIRFILTDGTSSARFGGSTDKGPNVALFQEGSTVLALYGYSGEVVDRLYGVYRPIDEINDICDEESICLSIMLVCRLLRIFYCSIV